MIGTRIVAFLLIIICVTEYLSIKFRPTLLTTIFYDKENSIDAVFLGSSAWYAYYAPMLAYESYGITSYDVSYGSFDVDVSKAITEEIMKKQKPRVLVVDARAWQYRDEWTFEENEDGQKKIKDAHFRNVVDTMPKGINRFNAITANVLKINDPLSEYFEILFYHNRYEEVSPGSLLTKIGEVYGTRSTYLKGFSFGYLNKCTPYTVPDGFTNEDTLLPLSDDTTSLLRDYCDYCASQDYKVLFVVVPLAEYTVEEKQQYNYISSIVSSYDNISFLNCNDHIDEIGMDYSVDYAEPMHANYEGAKTFTEYMADYLITHYNVPDRRTENFGNWKEDELLWNQYVQSLAVSSQ